MAILDQVHMILIPKNYSSFKRDFFLRKKKLIYKKKYYF